MTHNLIEDGNLNRSAAAESLQNFLVEIVKAAKLDLKVSVSVLPASDSADAGGAQVFADLSGRDKDLLLERGAELLHAIEHLALRAAGTPQPQRDRVGADGWGRWLGQFAFERDHGSEPEIDEWRDPLGTERVDHRDDNPSSGAEPPGRRALEGCREALEQRIRRELAGKADRDQRDHKRSGLLQPLAPAAGETGDKEPRHREILGPEEDPGQADEMEHDQGRDELRRR